MGDPAGIGPEITLKSLTDETVRDSGQLVVLGDLAHLRDLVEQYDLDVELRDVDAVSEASQSGPIDVIDFDNLDDEVTFGELNGEYGQASLEYVERALDLAEEGAVDGICNAPIHKKAISLAGSEHAGHTAMMVDRFNPDRHSVLISDGDLHVAHLSLHVPLLEAIEKITTENVLDMIETTADLLPEVGLDDPAIGVLGVNPHAGEGGVIGDIDDDEIRPAVEGAQENGIDAGGPLPPDSAFNRSLDDDFDCMLAMYHDQGHIPVQVNSHAYKGGSAATALTLGFPFIRTTTLHGTAYNIAGEGIAGPASMIASITNAVDAVRERKE